MLNFWAIFVAKICSIQQLTIIKKIALWQTFDLRAYTWIQFNFFCEKNCCILATCNPHFSFLFYVAQSKYEAINFLAAWRWLKMPKERRKRGNCPITLLYSLILHCHSFVYSHLYFLLYFALLLYCRSNRKKRQTLIRCIFCFAKCTFISLKIHLKETSFLTLAM